MENRRTAPSTQGLLLFALIAAVCPAQTEHTIGKLGAAVTLDTSWQRQKSKDYGDDTFVFGSSGGLFGDDTRGYVAVTELRGLFENEADYRRAFAKVDSIDAKAPIQVAREADWLRVSHSGEVSNGVFVHAELLVNRGLAYHLMVWDNDNDKRRIDQRVEQFLDGFAFPRHDSAFGKDAAEQPRSLEAGDLQLRFAAAPSVWLAKPTPARCLFELATADGAQSLTVMLWSDVPGRTAVDRELRALQGWQADLREVSRRQFVRDGVTMYELVTALDDRTLRTAIIPTGDRQVLVMRHDATGGADAARPEWDRLLASITLQHLAEELDLGPLPSEPLPQLPGLRTFLEGVEDVQHFDFYPYRLQRGPDGRWISFGYQQMFEFTPGGPSETWNSTTRWNSLAWWQGRWFASDDAGHVHVVDSKGAGEPQPFVADLMVAVGEDLLCWRRQRAVGSPVPSSDADSGQLVRRRANGEQTTVLAIPGFTVSRMVASASGGDLLLAGASREPLRDGAPSPTLQLADLAAGTSRRLGQWDAITNIGPADQGFVVTGAPAGRPTGIWLLDADAVVTELVTAPGVDGLQLADGRLWFTRTQQWSPTDCRLCTAAREYCERVGSGCFPFAVRQLATIGQRLMDDLGASPRTGEEVGYAITRLQQLATATFGRELPHDRVSLEQLLPFAASDQATRGSEFVLALLTTALLLDQGARWVDAPRADWLDWLAPMTPPESTAFAAVCNVARLVASVGPGNYDDEWNALSMLDAVRGRRLFVGIDDDALRRQRDRETSATFAATVQAGDGDAIAAMFAARAKNTYLRAQVYQALAVTEHGARIEALAKPWATGDQACADDSIAWLGWWAKRASDDELPALDAALLAAVRRYPKEAALYWLLGQTSERAFPDRPRRARPCYQRVLELQSYGDLAAVARAALERLQAK